MCFLLLVLPALLAFQDERPLLLAKDLYQAL
ncbi:hypothetical protein LMG33818_002130 [Halomonadaceae bacterium LMG 33818]